jgi:pilus assembly protein CpaB
VLLLIVAILGSIAVFLSVSSYVSRVRAREGELTRILRLTEDVEAFDSVPADAVQIVEMPEFWVPETVLPATTNVGSLVAASDLFAGSILQEGMVVPPPALQSGQREMAVLVDADTGVALKVTPGSTVDIIGSFEGIEATPSRTDVVIPCAGVIAVGVPRSEAAADDQGNFTQESVIPITFAVSQSQSLELAYAESFAKEVRLALAPPGDECTTAVRTYSTATGESRP